MTTREAGERLRRQKEELLARALEIDNAFSQYPKRVVVKKGRPEREIELMLIDFALSQPEKFCRRMGTRGLEKLLDLFEEMEA